MNQCHTVVKITCIEQTTNVQMLSIPSLNQGQVKISCALAPYQQHDNTSTLLIEILGG